MYYSLLDFQNNMEKNKSKIHDMLKKVSSSNFKHYRVSPTQNQQLFHANSPKKSCQTTPLKDTMKINNYQHHKLSSSTKAHKHIFNKTSYGTPMQKSAMMSYISTPNQNSMSASTNMNSSQNKLKKFKSNRKITNNSKTRQIYQSTEDENMSDQSVTVEFTINKKKLFKKKYLSFQKMEVLKKDFVEVLQHEKEVYQYYGCIGFDQVPYNHGVRNILNDSTKSFQSLILKKITQIVVQPIMVAKRPCYDQLQLTDFRLLQYLGSGGFSTVYLAKCEIDQKICALKFIKKQSITSAKKAKMLENQRQILFTISSSNLVDLLYAFETSNYIVFGLQYCPNGNLYNFIKSKQTLSQTDAKHIFSQILHGVEYLHKNNILFRDIKLENILFDENGKLKITDFGLSKPQLGEDQITYSYCGSPEYMAPEMLAKCGHSFQVDFYALGILLYELLYGISPFYASRKQDIFMAIMNSEPKFPKQPHTSKQVKQLIKGLLVKNPSYRIGSLKGIKQIRSHPWFRKTEKQQINPSETFNFPYDNLKLSTKQMKDLSVKFQADLQQKQSKKYFFPKSFVNKQLVDQLQKNTVIFEKKKNIGFKKNDKMVKSSSGYRFKNHQSNK